MQTTPKIINYPYYHIRKLYLMYSDCLQEHPNYFNRNLISLEDRFGSKVPSLACGGGYDTIPARVEGKDWWPEEIPSQVDFDNACRNLDKVGWKVDHVITHTCPVSQRPYFLKSSRAKDPTEIMLQELYEKLTFTSWHFGHFHINEQVGKFNCHFNKVQLLTDYI